MSKKSLLIFILVALVFSLGFGSTVNAVEALDIAGVETAQAVEAANAQNFLTSLRGKVADAASGAVSAASNKIGNLGDLVVGSFLAKMDNVLGIIIGALAKIVTTFEGFLITVLTKILIGVMSYDGFVNAKAVTVGWTLVRDIANLFFVVILLVIAIATILRYESYNVKKLLPKLILMAVLVNFSRTIAGLIIQASQIVMLSFVAAFQANAGANIYRLFHIEQMLNAVNEKRESGTDASVSLSIAVTALVVILLMAVVIIYLFFAVIIIVVRIVMLWMLLVLSPLAFVLAAFPRGGDYAKEWWKEFIKYCLCGPVLAFFLWLSLSTVTTTGELEGFTGLLDANEFGNTDDIFKKLILTGIGDVEAVLQFIIGIGMLMAGLMLTQKICGAGGKFAASGFNTVKKSGSAVVGAAGDWVSRFGARQSHTEGRGAFIRRPLGMLLSPRTVKGGFSAAKAKAERESYPEAVGAMHDFLNKANPLYLRPKLQGPVKDLVTKGKKAVKDSRLGQGVGFIGDKIAAGAKLPGKIAGKIGGISPVAVRATKAGTSYERIAARQQIAEEEKELVSANYNEIELGDEAQKALQSKNLYRYQAAKRQMIANRQEDDFVAGVLGETYKGGGESEVKMQLLEEEVFGEEKAAEISKDAEVYRENHSRTRAMGAQSNIFNEQTGKVENQNNRTPQAKLDEMKVKMGRGDTERLVLGNLEGKVVREVYGARADKSGKVQDKRVIKQKDFTENREVEARMGDATSMGIATYKAIPKNVSKAIASRGQKAPARRKEMIGFIDRKDGGVEFNSPATLVDAFYHNPDLASGLLSNLGVEDSTVAQVKMILEKAAAQKNDKGEKEYEGLDKIIKDTFEDPGNVNAKDLIQKAKAAMTKEQKAAVDSITRIYRDFKYTEDDFGKGSESFAPTRIEVNGEKYGSAADPEKRASEALGLNQKPKAKGKGKKAQKSDAENEALIDGDKGMSPENNSEPGGGSHDEEDDVLRPGPDGTIETERGDDGVFRPRRSRE